MPNDWVMVIAEQVALTSRKSREIEAACSSPETSLQAVGLMFADIKNLSLSHERMMMRLRNDLSPFDPLFDAAERLGVHWERLSTTLIFKMAELQAQAVAVMDERLNASQQ